MSKLPDPNSLFPGPMVTPGLPDMKSLFEGINFTPELPDTKGLFAGVEVMSELPDPNSLFPGPTVTPGLPDMKSLFEGINVRPELPDTKGLFAGVDVMSELPDPNSLFPGPTVTPGLPDMKSLFEGINFTPELPDTKGLFAGVDVMSELPDPNSLFPGPTVTPGLPDMKRLLAGVTVVPEFPNTKSLLEGLKVTPAWLDTNKQFEVVNVVPEQLEIGRNLKHLSDGLYSFLDGRDTGILRHDRKPSPTADSTSVPSQLLFRAPFDFGFDFVLVPDSIGATKAYSRPDPLYWTMFRALERQLRSVIKEHLLSLIGTNWVKQRVPHDVRQRWYDRQDEERAAGRTVYEEIQYADFMDLYKVIERRDNWRDVFQEIFRSKEDIGVSFNRLHPVRKALAHCRPLSKMDVLTLLSETSRIFERLSGRKLH